MDQLFQLASSISTPLALAGFFAAALFSIFRQILAKRIFPKLSVALGAQIIKAMIDKLFYLSLVAMLLGVFAFLTKPFLDKAVTSPTAAEQIAMHSATLSSGAPDARLLALSELGEIKAISKGKAESLIKILENHINRLNMYRRTSSSYDPRTEMNSAFHAMGRSLRWSDQNNFVIHRPEFTQLDAARLDLTGVYLSGITFTDSIFSETILDKATLTNVKFIGVKARRLTARSADLSAALIQQTCMEEGSFVNTNFTKTIFISSDLNNANLTGANLKSVAMDNSRLSLVNFQSANLEDANLTGALEFSWSQVSEGRYLATVKAPQRPFKKSKLTICKW